jgi:hypothetical protein
MMKKLSYIYLVIGGLLSIRGLIWWLPWAQYIGTSHPLLCGIFFLISLLPIIVFGIAFVGSRKPQTIVGQLARIALCAVLTVLWAVCVPVVEKFIAMTTEITDPAKYEQIIREHWSAYETRELVNHFPGPIPEDAKDARFSYQSLLFGSHIQLRHSTSPERIQELYEQFSKKKTKSFLGGNLNDHLNMKDGVPTTFFYTSDKGESDRFPEDYEIMVLDPVPNEKNRSEGPHWNHARCHGVAISKQRDEIVYWAERW